MQPARVVGQLAGWWQREASPRRAYVVAAVLGLTVYLLVFGIGFAIGESPYWNFPLGDHCPYVIGYRYFLHEPWHWRVFVSRTMDVPYTKSIAFTDSVPLWALVNKMVATVTPSWRAFSIRAYLGLWYGLCYVLQACMGVAIVRALGQRSWRGVILGALFFLAIPAWTMRFVHASLSAQFLLLWALYMYLRIPGGAAAPRRLRVVSVVQLAAAALINPYLTVMSLGIFVASVLRSRRLRSSATWIPIGIAAIALASWLAGYFAHEAKISMFGFDSASANVLTWFIPRQSGVFGGRGWIDPTGYQYEGSAYLGLGILVLLALFAPRARQVKGVIRRHAWLFALTAGAGLFALSSRIFFGPYQLAQFTMPHALGWVVNQFRCPGRFVWVPTYVLVAYLVAWGLRRYSTGWQALVMPVLAAAQLVDVSGSWVVSREHTRGPDNTPVDRVAWQQLVHAHDAVVVYPSYDCVLDGRPEIDIVSLEIEYLASERALPINGVYSARPTRDCARDTAALATTTVEDRTLYVLLDRMSRYADRLEALGAACADFAYGRVCSKVTPAVDRAERDGILTPTPSLGVPLHYGAKLELGPEAAMAYLEHGWSWSDPSGRWSDGPAATIVFRLTGAPPPKVALKLQAASVVCGLRREDNVAVLLDGVTIATLHFDASHNDANVVRTIPISDPSLLQRPLVSLEFRPEDFRALDHVRCNRDPRQLGVLLRSLAFE